MLKLHSTIEAARAADPSLPSDRVEILLRLMTLDEKIGQLNMATGDRAVTGPFVSPDYLAQIRAGAVGSLLNLWGLDFAHEVQTIAMEETRLGIPLLFGFDVVHGQHTIFPIPLGEAAAFDPALWETTAAVAAREAAADGLALTFAPMLDVCRDPRWGRIAEGPGEDPFVASRIAEAKVRGFQGGDLGAPDNIVANAKHYAAYGAVTGGRDYATTDVSERTLREVYLPPFRAAVAAGAAAIMPSFTDLAGVPMTANARLLRQILRGEWGFDGVVISDYNAIGELIAHGVAGDLVEAAALALKAGVDIDMMAGAYARGLPEALSRGLVTIAEIDEAVLRVLRLKERLGLLDDPFRGRGRTSPQPPHPALDLVRDLAREAARRSVVLLTNRNGALPLPREMKRLAVVGSLATSGRDPLGSWEGAGLAEDTVTIADGVRAAWPDAQIHVVPVELNGGGSIDFAPLLALCGEAEAVILCLGERADMSGEAASRAEPSLPAVQHELANALAATGKPVVALVSSGRPVILGDLPEKADAVLAVWFAGTEAGNAIADVLSGRSEPVGRLPVTWPRSVGQIPIYFGERPSGRPAHPEARFTSKYLDIPIEPLFPFGHGLGYTTFRIEALRVSPSVLAETDRILIEIDIANSGVRRGEATVFVFVRDLVASVARPLLELKGFEKIVLDPDELGTIRTDLAVADLAFLGEDLRPVLEPGAFEICVGLSADRSELVRQSVFVAPQVGPQV